MMKRKKWMLFAAPVLAVATLGSAVEAGPPPSCPITVLPNNNSTSGNARTPMPRYRFAQVVYLITAGELAAAGYTSGSSPTTIGWNYNANNGGGSGPLKIYMENTADTTNTKSTTFATAITGMTLVHDATTALPATAGPFDITMTGGSPFTYTGGGVYIAFDWGEYTGPFATTTSAFCNTALTNGLLGGQTTSTGTTPPASMTASSFRPETRLNGAAVLNDAAVTLVYSLGELPSCDQPAQAIGAVVRNNGADTLRNVTVTLNVTGANPFSDSQMVASLAPCGGQAVVTFASFTPTVEGSNTISVSVPADSNTANDTLSRAFNVTRNSYSYKIPGSTANGGVGLAAPGAFVAKFTANGPDTVTDVNLEFFAATATMYRVAIYGDNGGVPSTTPLYVDAADRAVTVAGPVTITLPAPVAVGPGNYYVGVHQTNATNANYSFDTENPIRNGSFFFATAIPPVTWINFAPGVNFKLNIGINNTACAAPCPADTDGSGSVDVDDLIAVILGWGPCPVPPPPCSADINGSGAVDVDDLIGVILGWGPCP